MIPFRDGWSLQEYVGAAGGVLDNGDYGKRFVEYANGAVRRPSRGFLFVGGDPRIRPGTTIFVPEKPPETGGRSFGEIFATTFPVVGTLASLAVAYLAATK